jgi:hypothetical protein
MELTLDPYPLKTKKVAAARIDLALYVFAIHQYPRPVVEAHVSAPVATHARQLPIAVLRRSSESCTTSTT